MSRSLKAEDLRVWARVVASVRPLPGKSLPALPEEDEPPAPAAAPRAVGAGLKVAASAPPQTPRPPPTLDPLEPLRKRRLVRGRDPIQSRLDLHGLDQDRARAALHSFLRRAHAEGHRSVLVITGKGALGDGVLRRRVPDWLSEADVRSFIAGVSQADRRHGGAGALYVALKRRSS